MVEPAQHSNSLDDFFFNNIDANFPLETSNNVSKENPNEINEIDDDGDGDDEDDEDEDEDDDEEENPLVVQSILNDHDRTSTKKRKHQGSKDQTTKKKKKKSKTNPNFRRNIRTLFTNDKLQEDTRLALKAEEERLKRLQEPNIQHPTIYAHLHSKEKSFDHDCIVLDDDDDENENENLTNPMNNIQVEQTNNVKNDDEDSNDSDVQCVDSDTEIVNDKLLRKMQRLHVDDRVNVPDDDGNIQVNINHPMDDPDLYIPKHLCHILKPHQIGGIRFMYDNIVESLERFRTTPGLGCILAHSMGCGKTLQVISFIDVLLRHTTAKSVLVVVPINTIQNWSNEFQRWSPIDFPSTNYQRPFQLYVLNETSKKIVQRAKLVRDWIQTGGTMIIGYEMFRLMVTKKPPNATSTTNKSKNILQPRPATPLIVDLEEEDKNGESMDDVRKALLNPDLVICDEGHRIKNHQAGVAVALKSIRTQRRIVLTGYPLQNNLIEYWCMVDFVRPNYLGSKVEFCNMFERPILNGQCTDSTPEDGKLMRARAHVLHSLLEGFIQRRGHDVLQADLPPKTEYVILLKLTPNQRQLYMKFLEAVGVLTTTTEKPFNPLRAFAICCKIWNHADVLYKFVRDRQDGTDLDLDFDLEQNSSRTGTPAGKSKAKTTVTNTNESPTTFLPIEKKEFDYDFANSMLNSYVCGQLTNGIKFQVALTLLDSSLKIGDKVLIFSQSLLSLNKLEEFLSQRFLPNSEQKWEKNVNYYRLDGGTNSLEREKLINAFNAPNSNAKLFLLSTRAGCLGINLIAANRVIVMDVSWNPCLDAQAVCRVYRYGQKKHCYIYRLIADFTMEKRIYDRQIAKQGMSDRVVDELQPQNQFTQSEVRTLLHFAKEEEPVALDLLERLNEMTDDQILKSTCEQYAQSITKVPFTHESLLCDRRENQLTSAEKRRAEREYQDEKRMNTFTSRNRLAAARSYARFPLEHHHPISHLHPSISFESRLTSSYPHLPTVPANITPIPRHIQSQSHDRKLEQLRQHGISVQQHILQNPLDVQINSSERQRIPAGVQIHLIQGPRGSYIRTPEGRFFAIRPSATNAPKLTSATVAPAPPPPPPPAAPQPTQMNSFDPFTSYDSPTTSLNDMNNFNDEIDLLFNDNPFSNLNASPSPSAFENLSTWQNGFFQQNQQPTPSSSTNNFYSDMFFNDSMNYFPSPSTTSSSSLPTTSVGNATIDTNSNASNALTFF